MVFVYLLQCSGHATRTKKVGLPRPLLSLCARGKARFRLPTPAQRPGEPNAICYQFGLEGGSEARPITPCRRRRHGGTFAARARNPQRHPDPRRSQRTNSRRESSRATKLRVAENLPCIANDRIKANFWLSWPKRNQLLASNSITGQQSDE
jgi:hypothetical protein